MLEDEPGATPPTRCPLWTAHQHHHPYVGVVLGGRIAPTNIRTHADVLQHSRRPTSAPVLNRYILFYRSFSSSFFFYLPMGYPSRPHPSSR